MKRECFYVNMKSTYQVGLRAMARYGFGKEEVDAYRFSSHALKVLVREVVRKGRKVARKL
jgi:hypothetical protein